MQLLRTALCAKEARRRAGRRRGSLIQKQLANGHAPANVARLLLLGQCTTSWLANAVVAIAWGQGSAVAVSEGEYDNVVQELLGFDTTEQRPGTVVLMPWNQRLFAGGVSRSSQERVDDELAFWRRAWGQCSARLAGADRPGGLRLDDRGSFGLSLRRGGRGACGPGAA